MEHNMATPPILPTPITMVKYRFLVLDLNRVLVQCEDCPKALIVPFSIPKNMDYGRLQMYFMSKFIYLQFGLCHILQRAQSKWWITM